MPENSFRTGEWFEAFYERNYKPVYRLCFTYMKNRAEAEDCTEDVFVKVLTGDLTFNNETHEKKWLKVTAINLCKDRLKHWWRKQVTPIDEAPEIPDENTAPIDETLEIVKKLPTKYKDVIYLHIRQYPFGTAKVLNARIYQSGNYVMYILAGASYDGEDSEAENKLAVSEYAKIDEAIKNIFGSLPNNSAVVPENDESVGDLITSDYNDDMPLLGGN